MCGISVVYRYTSISETDVQKLHQMCNEMEYRGPDERGYWNDEHCGMAHVRLSIIGLHSGIQPLTNEDKSLILVCNGEIYNYLELKDILSRKGHFFATESDSEAILHLYEEYGIECIHHLRGMFAFSLWDKREKKIFAARDRIGEKTLYYAPIPCGFVFCTELKPILKHFVDNPQLDLEELVTPIRYTSPLNKEKTYIEQIKRIEPGQYISIDRFGLRKFFYWKRQTKVQFTGSIEQAKKGILENLLESVKLCLRSDVPVAVMLSGGIDSSLIATLAKETGREVHSITAGYAGDHGCDERANAKLYAKEKGFVHHEIELNSIDYINYFDELTQYMDEPITDAASIAQWALYKKVKQLGFKVLLSGIGSDELFYGYPYWNSFAESFSLTRKHQTLFPWNSFDKKIRSLGFLIKNMRHILYAGYPMKMDDSSFMPWQYIDFVNFVKTNSMRINGKLIEFSEINFTKSFSSCELGKEIDLIYGFCFDNIMTMAYLYLADRLGMGNSLEIRSPFLDYKVVEFTSGLPLEMKYKTNQTKSLLKDACIGILPDYILNNKKRGFAPPDSFIKHVVNAYQYKVFSSKYKSYNTILADRILSLSPYLNSN